MPKKSSKRAHRDVLRAITAVTLLLSACATDDSVVELGRIELHDDAPRVDAPATASVGQPFVVTVMSYGDGCISLERTDVELTNEGADIRPFDRREIPAEKVCTQELRHFPHEATLAFDTAGNKTIRIHGRRLNRDIYEEIEIPVTVVVE